MLDLQCTLQGYREVTIAKQRGWIVARVCRSFEYPPRIQRSVDSLALLG